MRLNTNVIPLYRYRRAGEKITDAVDFIKRNRRPLSRLAIYFFLPVAMLHSLALYGIYNFTDDLFGDDFLTNLYLMTVTFFATATVIYTVVLTLVALNRDSECDVLSDMPMRQLWRTLWRILWRSAVAMAFDCAIACMLIAIGEVLLLTVVGIMFIPALPMAVALLAGVLAMLPIVYVLDRNGSLNFFQALSRSWKLSWAHGMRLMGLVFALYFIMTILQGMVDLPFYLLIYFKQTLWLDNLSAAYEQTALYSVLLYLLGVVKCFYSYLTYSFAVMVIVYHYGSVAENREDASIMSDIQRFEEL